MLGDPEAIDIVQVGKPSDGFTKLANGEIDVLMSAYTYTAERDIFQVINDTRKCTPLYHL